MASSTTFDTKYVIYKNTPGLKGNIHSNLTDSFKVSGVPLSATLTGSFTISTLSKTLSWTGELTLTPRDSWCTYLKCKSGDGSAQYFYAQNGKFKLGSSGQIGVAEFGFGILCTDAYLWDDGKNILSNLCIPVEMAGRISENTYNQKESFSKDLIDSYGDTVQFKFLNQIASYHTMPCYYVGTDQNSFKGISFDYNVKNYSDNSSDSGQFVFSNNISYKGGYKQDTKYWSFHPQAYPLVIFNNMVSVDAHYVDVTGSRGYYDKLNEHSFSYINGKLKIDNQEVTVADNDEVIFYIRRPGNWVASQITKEWSVSTNTVLELSTGTNTATLTFNPIEVYKWTPKKIQFSFVCRIDDVSKFITNNTVGSYTKSIIQHKDTFTETFPELTGSGCVYDNSGGLWMYDRLFASIGDYTFDTDSWDGSVSNVKKNSDASFTMSVEVKDLEWVAPGELSIIYSQENPSSQIEITNYFNTQHDSYAHVEAKLLKTFQSINGFFPKQMGYYGNKDVRNEDSTLITKYSAGITIDGVSYRKWYYNWYNVIGTYDSPGYTSTTSNELKLYIGYEQWVQEDTFALAVVVWRNGKLVK